MIYEFDSKMLKEIFQLIEVGTQSLDAIVFRAQNEEHIGQLNSLEKRGYIKNNDNRYSLSLAALDVIGNEVIKAKDILNNCSIVFQWLRDSYKQDPHKSIPLEDIVSGTQASETDTRVCLYYLRDVPIWSGYTTDILENEKVVVKASESILRYKTFDEVIKQLHSWCDIAYKPSLTSKDFLDKELDKSPREPQNDLSSTNISRMNIKLPLPLSRLLSEIKRGIDTELFALSSMGIRAAIDFICNDVVGDIGGFKQKLKALEGGGHITIRNKNILENTLELGHASAHRAHFPQKEELKAALKVLLHLLDEIYLLESKAKKIAESVPKRKQI